MKKTLVVSVIALLLIIAMTGTCFALYKEAATDKVITINAIAGADCNLTITESSSMNFASISPSNRDHSFDVTLGVNDTSLVDGVHGIFKVAVTGEIAEYIDITVYSIASVGAEDGAINNDAKTANGADIALSTVPQYFRVKLRLNDSGVTNFATVAELTGNVTVNWDVNQNSVFEYDANAYYVVGTVNGVTAWYPTAESVKMTTPGENGDLATVTHTFAAGDEFKIVKNYRVSAEWYGCYSASTADFTNTNEQIRINTAGSYKIDLKQGHWEIEKVVE